MTKPPRRTISSVLAAAFACMIAAVQSASADATTSVTTPVGYMTYTLTGGGTNTPIGVPLLDTEAYSGPSTTVGAQTLAVSTATWTPGEFAAANSPYFVTLLSGAQTGRTLLVTANTATSLTLETGDADLTAAGFAVVNGDRFEIAPGDTLSTFFGNNTMQPLVLTGGTSVFAADTVQIHDGVKFVSYFFNTSPAVNCWVMVNGGTTDQSNVVLFPDRGLMVLRRGVTTSFTVLGRVPATARLTKLPGGTTSAVSVRFPSDTTLGALNFAGPGTWQPNASVFGADTVSLWNGVKWVAYWQISAGGQWRQVNGGTTDQSATAIPAQSVLLILKRGSGTGPTAFFNRALPYPLN